MLAEGAYIHASGSAHRFVDREEDLQPADYTVASGIFNVKLMVERAAWHEYILQTLNKIAASAKLALPSIC